MRHALIFAAGRGERMRPLTDTTPKPLLSIGGKRLIEYHLEALARAGVREVVINTSHLAEQFPAALGDGTRWGVRIQYSYEGPQPLETGGGMLRALPLLGDAPFIAVNADTFCNVDFSTLPREPVGLAHLLMVDNPPQHPNGDFVLRDGLLHDEPTPRLTFAGVGTYRPELVVTHTPGVFSTVPILRAAMAHGDVSGAHFRGFWTDVGTPQRLAELDARLAQTRA
ncbi:MAG: nucleotidyltransferase family protein [Gammaproteobacteria bacterium]|nr:MAG: nucleotidyltransferase family protein [Gammaproteobacteria bacterium]